MCTLNNEDIKPHKMTDDDSLMKKDEFYSAIKQALKEVEAGETYAMLPNESLDDFMKRIQSTGAQCDDI